MLGATTPALLYLESIQDIGPFQLRDIRCDITIAGPVGVFSFLSVRRVAAMDISDLGPGFALLWSGVEAID